jgi:amino acid permease
MLGPRKSIERLSHRESGHSLAKTLSWPHLIALGVGAIVGTGIYTLTGVGAERAGLRSSLPLPLRARSAPAPRSPMPKWPP